MMTQLDLKCAQVGEALAQIKDVDEKLLNDAFAVLQEQGLYACFLYLHAQGKEPGRNMSRCLYDLLKEVSGLELPEAQDAQVLGQVAKLAENLDNLLFTRELLLQALMYARYHLKAKSGGGV